MAIQNFIGGGFKGKLGATIGQGWKNKKVIRTAFVPSNPRTVKQQSNRKDFAECVKMAQLAMQMDFRSVGFSSVNNTEWALRISSARKYFNKNLPAMYCIPLIPYGTVAKYAVSDDFEVSGNEIIFKIDTEDDLDGRSVSILLYLKKTGTEEYQYFIRQSSVTGTSGNWQFSAFVPTDFEIAENSLACAVSNDDTVLGAKIYRSPFSIFSPYTDIPFTLSNPAITSFATGDTKRTITFTPSVSLEAQALSVTGVTSKGVLQGFWQTSSGKVTSASANEVVVEVDIEVLDSLNQLVQFPAGSSITIPAFSFIVGENRYIYAGGTFSLSETTVRQTFNSFDKTEKTITNMGMLFAFEESVSSVATTLMYDVPYVQNGTAGTGIVSFYGKANASGKQCIAAMFSSARNYWGKDRSGSLADALSFTVLGVSYRVPKGTAITIEPYATSIYADINSASLEMMGIEGETSVVCAGTIGDDSIAPTVILWGSHARPSVSITSEGVTYDVGQPRNMNVGDGIRLLYPANAWDIPSNGTAIATFSEAFVEELEVANSDGFKMTLSVSVGSISGTYTFKPYQ